MAGILKNGRHLEFYIGQRYFYISTAKWAFLPILVLVSIRERFGQNVHLSAPLCLTTMCAKSKEYRMGA